MTIVVLGGLWFIIMTIIINKTRNTMIEHRSRYVGVALRQCLLI